MFLGKISMKFELTSEYSPTGDQPQAIKELVASVRGGEDYQTLLGVTGSGKTFTIANVTDQHHGKTPPCLPLPIHYLLIDQKSNLIC